MSGGIVRRYDNVGGGELSGGDCPGGNVRGELSRGECPDPVFIKCQYQCFLSVFASTPVHWGKGRLLEEAAE